MLLSAAHLGLLLSVVFSLCYPQNQGGARGIAGAQEECGLAKGWESQGKAWWMGQYHRKTIGKWWFSWVNTWYSHRKMMV